MLLNETATGFMPWSICLMSIQWKSTSPISLHGCSVFIVAQCYNIFYGINHAVRGLSVRNNSLFAEKNHIDQIRNLEYEAYILLYSAQATSPLYKFVPL